MSRARSLVLTLGAVVGGLCLAGLVLALATGTRPVVVRSGSMEPTIATGALGLTQRVDAADLRVGDIVTVPAPDGSVTHRIVELQWDDADHSSATLRLRGDANPAPDADLHRVDHVDRLVGAVPVAGRVVAWLGGPLGLLLLGGWAVFLLSVLLGRTPARAVAGAATVAVLGSVLATSALPVRPAAAAGWAAPVPVSGTAMKTKVVPPPATFVCENLGLLSLKFTWAAVPGATSYTLRWSGGSLVTSTLSAVTVGLVAAGTAWVEANVAYGGATWTSAPSPTRGYLVAAVALCG